MKHNQHNAAFRFQKDPVEFNKWTDKSLLQYCLGGTLYMPATRTVIDKLLAKGMPALKSMVMCFEDAIRAEDVEQAEDNVLEHLTRLAKAVDQGEITHDDIPLTFLRVRNPEQFRRFATRLLAEFSQRRRDFVIRCSAASFGVARRMLKGQGTDSQIVTLTPCAGQVRMIRQLGPAQVDPGTGSFPIRNRALPAMSVSPQTARIPSPLSGKEASSLRKRSTLGAPTARMKRI